MADIFLSYAREDHERAKPIVAALEARGWIVFWDQGILPGAPFREVLEKQLADARCALVLWSRESVKSQFVRSESQRALDRRVLVSARIDRVQPPIGFDEIQAADLTDWHEDPEAIEFTALVRAICDLIGGCANVILHPVDLHLITADRAKHGDLPPTVNMMCRVSNNAKQPLKLERIDLAVLQSGEPLYHLIWYLFYNAMGLEHAHVKLDQKITIAGESTWQRGVQLREPQIDIPNLWPAGSYEFELLGWADRRPGYTAPNIRTTFLAHVEPYVEREMTRWSRASEAEWDQKRASDRALGFALDITDLKTGL